MPESEPLTVDVRPLCAAGKPPLGTILAAVDQLEPGQDLLLIAPFKPIPLFGLLGHRGFRHESKCLDDGSWEIIFRSKRSKI